MSEYNQGFNNAMAINLGHQIVEASAAFASSAIQQRQQQIDNEELSNYVKEVEKYYETSKKLIAKLQADVLEEKKKTLSAQESIYALKNYILKLRKSFAQLSCQKQDMASLLTTLNRVTPVFFSKEIPAPTKEVFLSVVREEHGNYREKLLAELDSQFKSNDDPFSVNDIYSEKNYIHLNMD